MAGRHHSGKDDVMSVELSEQQQLALDARPEEPLRLIDPRTQQIYVLLRVDHYEKLEALLVEDDPVPDMYPLLADLQPEDWEDPAHYEGEP
jgi:hypothetical protein